MPYPKFICSYFATTTAPVYTNSNVLTNYTHFPNNNDNRNTGEDSYFLLYDNIQFIKNAATSSEKKRDKTKKILKQNESYTTSLQIQMDNGCDKAFLNFPFLLDRQTCLFLRKSAFKVMFIMRGLPGSGKSSIVLLIRALYSQAVVCSADDYFLSEDGIYSFNPNLLSAAHSGCQAKAAQACQQGVSIIVIDNTNVKRWEMRHYVQLANTHGYVVVTVQPRTPWRMDPLELAWRNKHGVPADVLRKKVEMFDNVIPSYYGWFLNEKKSSGLIDLASNILLQCIKKLSKFKKSLLDELRINPKHISEEMAEEILSKYHTRADNKSPLLHCTSKFCNRGKAPRAFEYHKRTDVQDACGQVFQLAITGLVITKKVMGARVTLNTSAALLFQSAAIEEWSNSLASGTSQKVTGLAKFKNRKKLNKVLKNVEKMEERNSSSNRSTMLSQKFPQLTTCGPLRSAHLTLKTFPGVESKEVNTDILNICQIECSEIDDSSGFVPVTGGQACYYGDGICCVYFDKPLQVKTIFSGYY